MESYDPEITRQVDNLFAESDAAIYELLNRILEIVDEI